jgi:hypothetical protein
MTASPATSAPAPLLTPVFTLGSALRWLGHECPDRRCSEPIDTLTASVWFIQRGERFRTSPLETLVLVDPAETGIALSNVRRMIDQVHWCTRGDAIRVRQQWPRRGWVQLPVPTRPPLSVLQSDRPTRPCVLADATGGDLRTVSEAKPW